jgi:hypothetical protein
MTTDRELLEAAARAAGIVVWAGKWPLDYMLFASPYKPDPDGKVTGVEWNPLTDDGDALRLAVKLGLSVEAQTKAGGIYVFVSSVAVSFPAARELLAPDPYAATRRAIVRAAAASMAKA